MSALANKEATALGREYANGILLQSGRSRIAVVSNDRYVVTRPIGVMERWHIFAYAAP